MKKGMHLSEETKRRISESQKGIIRSDCKLIDYHKLRVRADKCFECNSEILRGAIKQNVEIDCEASFCSEGCRESYVSRMSDKILKIVEERFKAMIDLARKESYENGKNERDEDISLAFKEGYFKGLEDMLKLSRVCPRCRTREIESIHHIVPREFKGGDNIENLIFLCRYCHNEVEIETGELYKRGKIYSTETLRSFILGEFPEIRKEVKQYVT